MAVRNGSTRQQGRRGRAGAVGNDERGSAQQRAEDRRAEDPRAADGKVTFIAFGIFQA